ncbi:hypothetical protein GTA08_BOTSDO10390 [Neofusicoccum parvum]|uniref:Mediator of RNA polymerase II transcription subunit 21 n=2 Tax=Neofusicoccum parvum TaxID=310453 RepID=R1GCK3_BOTPV|nr:putative mediator of rna polymerase ii transcription subunit 21 protein [Neofusicoccum parvum UCRNP2]GME23790.1 hypothetical protein GTA08_BOTSDO10390 [Neofusicoccum parvum]GME42072.1 hypothetical protein GTA08_BOTSDO10390 [Neofusicoccum parvum]
MADILTQLQQALDTLVQQMYAGVMYTNTRHPYADIPGQPHDADRDQNQPGGAGENGPANDSQPGGANNGNGDRPRSPPPDPDFAVTQHEIASDIIMNMARINALADRLPGIGFSEQQQMARLEELDRELREEGQKLQEAKQEKDRLLGLLDERIMKTRRP